MPTGQVVGSSRELATIVWLIGHFVELPFKHLGQLWGPGAINIKTTNWSNAEDKLTVECSVLNGTSLSYTPQTDRQTTQETSWRGDRKNVGTG